MGVRHHIREYSMDLFSLYCVGMDAAVVRWVSWYNDCCKSLHCLTVRYAYCIFAGNFTIIVSQVYPTDFSQMKRLITSISLQSKYWQRLNYISCVDF